jgi:hypothetical protein
MTPEEVKKDQDIRFSACKEEVGAVLKKYEYDLDTMVEMPGLKIATQLRFVDLKKYEIKENGVDVAQEEIKTPYDGEIGQVENK